MTHPDFVDDRFGPQGIAGHSTFTPRAKATGQSAISVPVGMSGAFLPIGTQPIGRFGEDATVLAPAAQIEAATPWAALRPRLV